MYHPSLTLFIFVEQWKWWEKGKAKCTSWEPEWL